MASNVDLTWDSARLGDCATWLSGGTPSTSEPEYWSGDIPWITASSLRDFFIRDSERRVTERGVANGTRLVPRDTTIVVVRGMSLRREWRVGITTRAMAFGQDCKALVPDDHYDPLFFAYATKAASGRVLRLVERAGHGTGRLSTGALKDVEIPLPPMPEQYAISQVLRTVQVATEATEQVVAAAREVKKSLMRHLFTHGPVSVGETESVVVKESEVGDIPAHWVVQPIGDVVEVQRGQVDPRIEPYSSMLHVGPDNIEEGTGRLGQARNARDLGLISGKYLFEPGWVLYSKIRPYLRKAALPDFVGICSADMYPLRPSSEDLDLRYLFRYLLSDKFTHQAVSYQSRTGIPKINRLQLSQVPIPLPDAVSQVAIASNLSALDLKIAAEDARRDALVTLFDSLLHDLMTARLRVTDLITEVV